MRKKPKAVQLTKAERGALETFVAHGTRSARAITRARLLLLADEGRKDKELTEILGVSRGTVHNVCKKYQQKAYPHILDLVHDAPRSGRPIKLDQRVEAKVTMIACSAPPTGCGRWTLHMIADKLVKLEVTDSISHQSVRRLLKKTNSSRG
jgi:putative transposase